MVVRGVGESGVVTRFAPSPTGYLHLGGARTALFNWLFARGRDRGGRFLLRIEDTDKVRSTVEAREMIVEDLRWLGLLWDGEIVYQSERQTRHQEVALELLRRGMAYRCYRTAEELAALREVQRKEGVTVRYDGYWRDRDESLAPVGVEPVIRLRASQTGETVFHDTIQGTIRVSNTQLDDLVLLRSDGSPTYMLAVVVDDYDMGITHVIRGDDHVTNTLRQIQIYQALGWDIPNFSHISMIHGVDGARLSKRHGALGVYAYREQGYLPEALRNYLLRLGWSYGDQEFFTLEESLRLFTLERVGRSPARFDVKKLESMNGYFLRQRAEEELVGLVVPRLEVLLGFGLGGRDYEVLRCALGYHKQRVKTLDELAWGLRFYFMRLEAETEKARRVLLECGSERIGLLLGILGGVEVWDGGSIEDVVRDYAELHGMRLVDLAQPLRVALTGTTVSPPIFKVAELLGYEETLVRLRLSCPDV